MPRAHNKHSKISRYGIKKKAPVGFYAPELKGVLVHPANDLLPLMPPAALQAMTNNIRAVGLWKPILARKGVIIDGKNRYVACTRAGVEPRYREFEGKLREIYRVVVSLNLLRTEMDEEQKAACLVACDDYAKKIDEEAYQKAVWEQFCADNPDLDLG